MEQVGESDLSKNRLMEEDGFLVKMLKERLGVEIDDDTTTEDIQSYISFMEVQAKSLRRKLMKNTEATDLQSEIADMEMMTDMLKKKVAMPLPRDTKMEKKVTFLAGTNEEGYLMRVGSAGSTNVRSSAMSVGSEGGAEPRSLSSMSLGSEGSAGSAMSVDE